MKLDKLCSNIEFAIGNKKAVTPFDIEDGQIRYLCLLNVLLPNISMARRFESAIYVFLALNH